jgi:LPPG:FO 2-phospho-L-lactate transferase
MSQCVSPTRLNVIVNTADDAVFHGLHVSPDLDTVMYSLAGIADRKKGWGIDRDTYSALSLLTKYGEETWFHLGDNDLATHVLRTKLLHEGRTLTEITSLLTGKLGIMLELLPMTEKRVQTLIRLSDKWFPFQEYFVKHQKKGPITGIRFKGIRNAIPTRRVTEAVHRADVIVFAPSNPVVSILPIISLRGFKGLLKGSQAVKVAVSPFVGNRAVSGPAKELMEAIGYEGSSLGLAKLYSGLINLLVIHKRDFEKMDAIKALGVDALITQTVMRSSADKRRLAKKVLNSLQRR